MDVTYRWESLFQVHERAFEKPEMDRWYARIRMSDPALAPIDNVGNLRQILKPSAADPDRQDALLAAMIGMVQRGGTDGRFAEAVLWVAFRPALEGVYRRWVRWFHRGRIDELVSHVAAVFVRQIHESDLSGIKRVAGTVSANVARDVMRLVTRGWVDDRRWSELPDEEQTGSWGVLIPAERFMHEPEWCESLLGVPLGLSTDQEIEFLRARLSEMVGQADANLLVDIAVLGENQRLLAEATGRGYEDIRYRYRRAREAVQVLLASDPLRLAVPNRAPGWRHEDGN